MNINTIKAPFPWFGGKSLVAPIVWERFGDVGNYVEPFFGSGATLLGRPHEPRIETVNDKDGFVCNAWRAIASDPDQVFHYADWPVNENDLHARHIWLVNRRDELSLRLEGDPDYYDTKIAGWWLWGMACWIGSGFCSGNGPWTSVDGRRVHLEDAGQGVHRSRVHLGNAGTGVNRQLVHLGNAGMGLSDWMNNLSNRMRHVRVCCGDWSRVMGPAPTYALGLTGVFLDPPYASTDRHPELYNEESLTIAHDVRQWCIQNGPNSLLRIAICGYEGEHNHLEAMGWDVVKWKAGAGYVRKNHGNQNRHSERIWFSPHCLHPANEQMGLFEPKGQIT